MWNFFDRHPFLFMFSIAGGVAAIIGIIVSIAAPIIERADKEFCGTMKPLYVKYRTLCYDDAGRVWFPSREAF